MAPRANFIEGSAFAKLNDVISSFRNDGSGYAQPNRFDVVISPPAKVGGGNRENPLAQTWWPSSAAAREVSLRCESLQLPGSTLSSSPDNNIYGPTREIVEGVTYAEDLNMTFQASSGLDERVFFESWQGQAFSEETWNIGYYKDYIADIDIYLLDKQDQRRYGLKIHEAFPKTITATDLNFGTGGEIIKIAVGFSFRYWTTLDIDYQASNAQTYSPDSDAASRSLQRNLNRSIEKLGPGR